MKSKVSKVITVSSEDLIPILIRVIEDRGVISSFLDEKFSDLSDIPSLTQKDNKLLSEVLANFLVQDDDFLKYVRNFILGEIEYCIENYCDDVDCSTPPNFWEKVEKEPWGGEVLDRIDAKAKKIKETDEKEGVLDKLEVERAKTFLRARGYKISYPKTIF